jgi:hypothetical protein
VAEEPPAEGAPTAEEAPSPPEQLADPGVRRTSAPRWLDVVVVLAGAVALGASFLPWYAATAQVVGRATSLTLFSENAWQLGVLGWLGVLLAGWAAAAALLQRAFGSADVASALAPAALTALLAAAGLTLVLIRTLTLTRAAGTGHGLVGTEGPAIGSYLALAALAVELGFAGARLYLLTRRAGRTASPGERAGPSSGHESSRPPTEEPS